MLRSVSAKKITTVILVMIVIGVFFLWWQVNATRKNDFNNSLEQVILKKPVKLNDFDLKDSNGPAFTNQSLQGRWAFMYFGYTSCGEICTKTMNTLSQFYEQLKAQPQLVPLILFISIKPQEDSSTKIKQYITSINPNFLGLTDKEPNLSTLIQELGSEYIKLKSPGIGDTVDGGQLAYTGTIFLIDPTGKLRAIFSMPYTADSLATDYKNISNNKNKASI